MISKIYAIGKDWLLNFKAIKNPVTKVQGSRFIILYFIYLNEMAVLQLLPLTFYF